MGIMNTYHGYNNPMYNAHKNIGAHYAWQNTGKPISERQTPYGLTYLWNLKNKMETETWVRGTDSQLSEGRGGEGRKKVKGLTTEHKCITLRLRQNDP